MAKGTEVMIEGTEAQTGVSSQGRFKTFVGPRHFYF
jgi:hypothetical protein